MNPIHAVSITDLRMVDVLNADLSMRETIVMQIENNTEKEFKLVLPGIAYNITFNGTGLSSYANNTISDEIACEKCEVTISYSFPNIILNDSENYAFYRKIEMPINITAFTYTVSLPENHSLFNITDLQTSIIPNPATIIGNDTFEWYYDAPEFPKEFAVRYKEILLTQLIKKPLIEKNYLQHILFVIVVLILFIVGVVIGMFFRKKRRK
jgi:hypothetical protein